MLVQAGSDVLQQEAHFGRISLHFAAAKVRCMIMLDALMQLSG
jgi:hypothetical protein